MANDPRFRISSILKWLLQVPKHWSRRVALGESASSGYPKLTTFILTVVQRLPKPEAALSISQHVKIIERTKKEEDASYSIKERARKSREYFLIA
jgi:hypothetical protein